MENWRSPLASIPPSSAGRLGEHRATQVATAELRRLKLQLVSRKKNTRRVVGAHTARAGGRNKLARKENGDGPNAHTPSQATSVWPLSEMAVFLPQSCGHAPRAPAVQYCATAQEQSQEARGTISRLPTNQPDGFARPSSDCRSFRGQPPWISLHGYWWPSSSMGGGWAGELAAGWRRGDAHWRCHAQWRGLSSDRVTDHVCGRPCGGGATARRDRALLYSNLVFR